MTILILILIAAQMGIPPTKIPVVPSEKSATVAPPAAPRRKLDRATALSAVRSEWARHDVGAKGRLTPLEFSTWVMQANGATVAPAGAARTSTKGIAPTSAMNAAATAFARADANHDGGVTPDEMADFLTMPPAGPVPPTTKSAYSGRPVPPGGER